MHVPTEASGVNDAHARARRLDQHMINADLTVFINDHGDASEEWAFE